MSTQHILQVSELTRKVKFMLESEFYTVWLTGEISNLVCASSGHWYLSLKDSKSQVRCAMFKMANKRVRLSPQNGQQVLVKAKVSLYEPRGDFQLIIEQMEDAGEGLLRQKYQQLKDKLTAEGVFSLANKKAIPTHIKRVAVITSPTGAAVRDIITVFNRRNPSIELIIYPSLVQGEKAAQNICDAIALANARKECDVILVGRGGGSLEDLWCFNEESVVLAIAQSTIPTVSAIGHETDTTLSDYASDLRAATPSAGAELLSTDKTELLKKLAQVEQQLYRQLLQRQLNLKQSLTHLTHRLQRLHPEQQLFLYQQKNDELQAKLSRLIQNKIAYNSQCFETLTARLISCSPTVQIAKQTTQLNLLTHHLNVNMAHLYQRKAEKFGYLVEQLQLVSPLATIARGYSVVRNAKNEIIKSSTEVSVDEEITLQLVDGLVHAKVISQN
jgi:exodeoxyribonuclease VII large subunit